METIDPAKAARVWQRVQAGHVPEHREQGLLELISQELTDAVVYSKLSQSFQGKERATLRQIAQQEQSHAACLKGIYTLLTGKSPVCRAMPINQKDPQQLLRLCYGQEMRCLAQYESRCSDPEFGKVYAHLAQQEQQHCRMVLELLGKS